MGAHRSSRALLAAALAFVGCADIAGLDGNPQMRPGQDCLSCHSATGQASSLTFSVAGTIFPAAYAGTLGGLNGAQINIVDANDRHLALQSNGAGNFYSAESLKYPLQVAINYGDNQFIMQSPVPIGSCNACHRIDETLGFPRATPLVTELAQDAGFSFPPPGHIYAYDSCPVVAPNSCPDPVPSYAAQIQPILEINCLLCHSGSNNPDLSSYDAIVASTDGGQSNLSEDRDQIAGCLMPTNVVQKADGTLDKYFKMSPDEAEIVIGWINCGAPNN